MSVPTRTGIKALQTRDRLLEFRAGINEAFTVTSDDLSHAEMDLLLEAFSMGSPLVVLQGELWVLVAVDTTRHQDKPGCYTFHLQV